MQGLNATLSMASEALSAESGALEITNNNITNVNTAGYSRETVNLSAKASVDDGAAVQSGGVAYNGFSSVRNAVLLIGIQQKTSDVGSLTAQSSLWSQVESGFSGTTTGVGAAVSSLFSAISTLSATPTSAGGRQAALSAAQSVVDAFHQAAANLADAQTQANSGVSGIVTQINQLTSQIATLNAELSPTASAGKDGGSLQDQRDALTTQLAGLTGIVSTSTQTVPSLTTAGGSPLVVGSSAFTLQVSQGTDGKQHVLDAQGKDITAALTGGSLGGTLAMRDAGIPQISANLSSLASQFATAMNTAQAAGYNAAGTAGAALFSLPTDGTSAAAGLGLAITDGAALALSSDQNAGDGGNVSKFLSVQNSSLPGGKTPTDTYASLVQTIGSASASVSGSLTATNAALTQLTAQQASESGVSIDEETTNLLRFQQAYTAAAKVVSIVNDLYSTLMNMGVVTG